MDSFHEPYTRIGDDISLDEVRKQVRALEDEHKAHGIPLSGRILHVCHYLPITCTMNSRPGAPSPPSTPTLKEAELKSQEAPLSSTDNVWTLTPRYGHAAMISGIRSLAATHQQLIIGWTGDIQTPVPNERVPEDLISDSDKLALEDALKSYTPKESDPDDDKKTGYVPVWLNDLVAHGHYDGYCKQSQRLDFVCLLTDAFPPVLWPLFHYLLWQDVATEYASADSHYPFYEAANAVFARRIAEVYKPGDLIWVHDYHLLLLPKLLRELIPEAVLGLFVHTPFPSSEVFRCLPSMLCPTCRIRFHDLDSQDARKSSMECWVLILFASKQVFSCSHDQCVTIYRHIRILGISRLLVYAYVATKPIPVVSTSRDT